MSPGVVQFDSSVPGGKKAKVRITSDTIALLRTRLRQILELGGRAGHLTLVVNPTAAVPGCPEAGDGRLCLRLVRQANVQFQDSILLLPGLPTVQYDPSRVLLPGDQPGAFNVNSLELFGLDLTPRLPSGAIDKSHNLYLVTRVLPAANSELRLAFHPEKLEIAGHRGGMGLWLPATLSAVAPDGSTTVSNHVCDDNAATPVSTLPGVCGEILKTMNDGIRAAAGNTDVFDFSCHRVEFSLDLRRFHCNLDAEVARDAEILGDACDPVPCPRFTPVFKTPLVTGEVKSPLYVDVKVIHTLDRVDVAPIGSRKKDSPTLVEVPVEVAKTEYRYCIDSPPPPTGGGTQCFVDSAVTDAWLTKATSAASENTETLWHRVRMNGLPVGTADGPWTYQVGNDLSRVWGYADDFQSWRTTAWGAPWVPDLAGQLCNPDKDPGCNPQWPRAGLFQQHFLRTDRDGAMLLVASSTKHHSHALVRLDGSSWMTSWAPRSPWSQTRTVPFAMPSFFRARSAATT